MSLPCAASWFRRLEDFEVIRLGTADGDHIGRMCWEGGGKAFAMTGPAGEKLGPGEIFSLLPPLNISTLCRRGAGSVKEEGQ